MTGAPASSPAQASREPAQLEQESAWSFACQAAALFAIDPRLGGVALHAGAGPVRDAWLDFLRSLLPPQTPFRRMPLGIGDERLLGGLDLAATLRAGRVISQMGLLAEAHQGLVIMPMAERVSAATAARIAHAFDRGEVIAEREGLSVQAPAQFGLILLDEGQNEDEQPPAALLDRLAFHLDLTHMSYKDLAHKDIGVIDVTPARIAQARARLQNIAIDDEAILALAGVAARLGVASLRALSLALRAALASCTLRGADQIAEEDIVSAARFVLAPRATQVPASQEEVSQSPSESEDQAEEDPNPAPQSPPDQTTSQDEAEQPPQDLSEIILAAALATLPAGLLSQIKAGRNLRVKSDRSGKSGGKAPAGHRGRPIGTRPGALREGRLGLVDTLRAAAPWQRLRTQTTSKRSGARFVVQPEDFRIKRYKQRRQTTAIFVVDASGSSAVQRLAEVKGAIELLLVDCYARRDSVALIAFRGTSAEIILPPTRSLARAKRVLAGLPGGGGTPIAAGIDTALGLADAVQRKGQTPFVVLMTDGRANVTRTGAPGRAQAFEEALQSVRQIRLAGIAALAIDTSAARDQSGRQSAQITPTAQLSQAMNAHYVRLPYINSAAVSQAVRAALPAS